MPELLERTHPTAQEPAARPDRRPGSGLPARTERAARDDLRRQIAGLERRLGETFAATFPRRGIEWRGPSAGGPRLLAISELERTRDELVDRLRAAQAEIARQGDLEQANHGLLEEMVAAPERHRWLRISNRDLGEPGCRHWHSRPRFGILGLLLNWWRVKLSSGCPLSAAGCPRAKLEARGR